tara:strand:+ start:423 stop:692 length:270 start_codon:yes stop_codon:yes gene_type:complete
MSERSEALMRIVVGLVSGIILSLWKALVQFITIIHFFYTLITNKRSKDLAVFCNYWDTHVYKFIRYMTFTTNERPFPFTELGKNMEEVK